MRILLNGLTLVALLTGSLSVWAASLCRSTLLNPPTQAQIEATLDGLARMKLSLDLEKAQGTPQGSEAFTGIKVPYQEKRQEFLNLTGLDAKTFSEQMRLRIARLQEQSKENKKTEEKAREEMAPLLVSKEPHFKFVQSTPIPTAMNFIFDLAYLEFRHGIISTERSNNSQRALFYLDLATQKVEALDRYALAFQLSADHKMAYVLNHKGQIKTYSLKTLKQVSSLQLEMPEILFMNNPGAYMDISPAGDKIVISHKDVRVFDFSTGKQIASFDTTGVSKFLSENEILLTTSTGYSKYNLQTQQEIKKDYDFSFTAPVSNGFSFSFVPPSRIIPLGFDRNSQILLLRTHEDKILHINAQDLSIIGETNFKEIQNGADLMALDHIPHSDGYYMAFSSDGKGLLHDKAPGEVYDSSNLLQHYSAINSVPTKTGFSPDGKTMVVLVRQKDGYFTVDTWKDSRP